MEHGLDSITVEYAGRSRELGGTTRGAKGYHLARAVTAPGAATLWLAGAASALARLAVKSERLAGLG
jgi:hypothetical protein